MLGLHLVKHHLAAQELSLHEALDDFRVDDRDALWGTAVYLLLQSDGVILPIFSGDIGAERL